MENFWKDQNGKPGERHHLGLNFNIEYLITLHLFQHLVDPFLHLQMLVLFLYLSFKDVMSSYSSTNKSFQTVSISVPAFQSFQMIHLMIPTIPKE